MSKNADLRDNFATLFFSFPASGEGFAKHLILGGINYNITDITGSFWRFLQQAGERYSCALLPALEIDFDGWKMKRNTSHSRGYGRN